MFDKSWNYKFFNSLSPNSTCALILILFRYKRTEGWVDGRTYEHLGNYSAIFKLFWYTQVYQIIVYLFINIQISKKKLKKQNKIIYPYHKSSHIHIKIIMHCSVSRGTDICLKKKLAYKNLFSAVKINSRFPVLFKFNQQ